MSRILKVMIVLLAIAAIAAPAMAEDRLGLAGQMRVRGWYVDNGGDNTNTYADQRLRVGGKLSVAEGVSVTFRTDITESKWGRTGGDGITGSPVQGNGFGSGRSGAAQQWDRAHLDLEKGNLHLRAGQQYLAFGKSGFDAQDNGLAFNLKGAMPITLFYMIDDNNDTTDNGADAYWAGARIAHSTDAYGASLYVANQNDGMEEDVYVIGLTAETKMDGLTLYGEADFFTGDANEAAGTDAMGTQVFVDASLAASEMATVGAQVFYAQGADNNETQYVLLGNDFGGWDPIMDVGTGLDNEAITAGRPFDLFGGGAGVIAGRLYANVKASDALNLGAGFTYAEPEEDNNTTADSAYALAGGLSYALMANTKLDAKVQYTDIDAPGADEITQAGVGLFVNF